ncbi:hypothetical protein BB558_003490 [Smittium angustum]|uniref:SMP-LTD domain-containing protein n=1 Tax=Smittium angustum TaxID=133377 RepID=A0A2U1J5W9_SMIAN|nr:hypothetical protein BB558_003490 [Smittium angustum]
MSFKFKWGNFSNELVEETKVLLTNAINKNSSVLPPNLVAEIKAPVLEILEVVDLNQDYFKAIFKMTYDGDMKLVFQTLLQANPLSEQPSSIPTAPSMGIQFAQAPLIVPMFLKISDLVLKGIIVLAVSKRSGVTLVFKNEPLVSVKVSSSFDNVRSIQRKLQLTIENVLRKLFHEELPKIVHVMSMNEINRNEAKLEQERLRNTEEEKNRSELRLHLLETRNKRLRDLSNSSRRHKYSNSTDTRMWSAPEHNGKTDSEWNRPSIYRATTDDFGHRFSDPHNVYPADFESVSNYHSPDKEFLPLDLAARLSYLKLSEKNSTSLDKLPSDLKYNSDAYSNENYSISKDNLRHSPSSLDDTYSINEFLETNTEPAYDSTKIMSAFLNDEYRRHETFPSDKTPNEYTENENDQYIITPNRNNFAANLASLMTSGHTITPYTRTFEHTTFRSNINNDSSTKGGFRSASFISPVGTPMLHNDHNYHNEGISVIRTQSEILYDGNSGYYTPGNSGYISTRHSRPIKKTVIHMPKISTLLSSGLSSPPS